jgi:hypothetical protein
MGLKNTVQRCGPDSFVSDQLSSGELCEHCNESSGSIKGEKCLDSVSQELYSYT